jgi:L-threonylcarbamoyladenylate synthase
MNIEKEIKNCINVLENGGVILYPTDTVWGLGCDATNEKAVASIFNIKKRADTKNMIILLPTISSIQDYASEPNKDILNILNTSTRPTTIIYPNAKNLANNLIASDNTIAIRIPNNQFCLQLMLAFGKPIVSTSANISGEPTPTNFNEINASIKEQVNYICSNNELDNLPAAMPSKILKWNNDNTITTIRP